MRKVASWVGFRLSRTPGGGVQWSPAALPAAMNGTPGNLWWLGWGVDHPTSTWVRGFIQHSEPISINGKAVTGRPGGESTLPEEGGGTGVNSFSKKIDQKMAPW